MPGAAVDDTLAVTLDGEPLTAAETLIGGEGRTHLLSVGRPGRVVMVAINRSTTQQVASVSSSVSRPLRIIHPRTGSR